jgi:hypothetical protein
MKTPGRKPPTGGHLFQKGNKLGGRKPIPPDVKEIARGLSPAAITTLGEIMKDKGATAGARVSAAATILDRAYGKAPQHITMERVEDLTNAELADELNTVIAGLRTLGVDATLSQPERGGSGTGDPQAGSRVTH